MSKLAKSTFFCLLDFKKQNDEQTAPSNTTIRRANVVLSPTSASLMESSIPKKLTVSLMMGALVPVDDTKILILIFKRSVCVLLLIVPFKFKINTFLMSFAFHSFRLA